MDAFVAGVLLFALAQIIDDFLVLMLFLKFDECIDKEIGARINAIQIFEFDRFKMNGD